jgi:acetoin utilization deacetylase AcuC-like enzyme
LKILYADTVPLSLPPGHRFPAVKYPMLRQRIFDSGLFAAEDLISAQPASEEQLLRVHTQEYVEKVLKGTLSEKEQRRIGLPWSPELVDRSRRSVGGTVAACHYALIEGAASYIGGGTHHAYPDHGEGYCVFNDVAVAVRDLQSTSLAQRIVILDLDVHQGNGTAAIFAKDPHVFTFSIHGEKNFPYYKEQSHLDIALPDGSNDQTFLEAVDWGVDEALMRSSAELAIFIAGADPYSGDRLGRLNMTKEGLALRDRMVFEKLVHASLPVAVVMGGGYAPQIEDVVDIHFQTLLIANEYHPV